MDPQFPHALGSTLGSTLAMWHRMINDAAYFLTLRLLFDDDIPANVKKLDIVACAVPSSLFHRDVNLIGADASTSSSPEQTSLPENLSKRRNLVVP
jgi:hypothetical protein